MKIFLLRLTRAFSTINKNTWGIILLNLVIALTQFIILTLINQKLGKEILGVWSLVVAATSIGQISSFGLSNGLVRYLPEFFIKKEFKKAETMVSTVTVSNFLFSLPLIILLYFPIMMYANHLLKGIPLNIFSSVIIWSMVGLFVNTLFSVYSFLFDALQKYYIRCIIQIAGWLLFLALSIALMPTLKLKGVAIAYVSQAVFQFITARIVIERMKIFNNRGKLFKFDRHTFKLIFSFGTKYQSISVLVIFFDPLVKFFITKGIGLTGTANYELANKIVMQGRNLLVSANQVIIPKVVSHRTNHTLNEYFGKIAKRNLFLSVLMGLTILVLSPIAIILFSGHFDRILLLSIVIVNVGWVCNTITSVHYYTCIGIDKLNKLVALHLLYSLIAIACFFILLKIGISPLSAIAIPSLSLLIGSVYNSMVLSEIKSSFTWLQSNAFIYFILVSLITFFIPVNSFFNSIILLLVFFLLFLFLFRTSLKNLIINRAL